MSSITMANQDEYTVSSRFYTASITTVHWTVQDTFDSVINHFSAVETKQFNIRSIPNSNFYLTFEASKDSSYNNRYCNIKLVFVYILKFKGILHITVSLNGQSQEKKIIAELSCTHRFDYNIKTTEHLKNPNIKFTICHQLWAEDEELPQDQLSLKTNTLINDLELLYNNNSLSDFTIYVEDCVFRVHKTVLAARSRVFNKMFTSNMKEQQDNCVYVTGMSPKSFEIALYFMYTGKIKSKNLKDEEELLIDVYILADRYELNDLKSICEDILKNIVTATNVIIILNLAHMTNNHGLKKVSTGFINDNKDAVYITEDFKALRMSKSDLFIELLSFLAGVKDQGEVKTNELFYTQT